MENEKKKNDWLNALKGMERAKPNTIVFQKITERINNTKRQEIPIYQLNWAAVAAVLLLFLNIFAIQQSDGNSTSTSNIDEMSLFFDYNIYEE